MRLIKQVTRPNSRHTFGRSLIDRSVDLPTVQNLMGHKRIDSTARYTKPSASDLERAVARLEIEEAPAITVVTTTGNEVWVSPERVER